MSNFDLLSPGITVDEVWRIHTSAKLYAHSIRDDSNCAIAELAALVAYARVKIGASLKDLPRKWDVHFRATYRL